MVYLAETLTSDGIVRLAEARQWPAVKDLLLMVQGELDSLREEFSQKARVSRIARKDWRYMLAYMDALEWVTTLPDVAEQFIKSNTEG